MPESESLTHLPDYSLITKAVVSRHVIPVVCVRCCTTVFVVIVRKELPRDR